MKPEKLDADGVQSAVTATISDAVSFIESEISEDRIKAQKYVAGRVDFGAEEGRSKVVATVCRDVVRAVKPSLMRVFLQTDKAVECVPKGPEDVAAAEQATAYLNWKFWDNGGYNLMVSVIHDALVKKTGFAKVWWEETEEVEYEEYSSLTDDQLVILLQDDEIEVTEHEARIEEIDGFPITLHDLKIERRSTDGDLKFAPIPPESFFVDGGATCIHDALVCGHSEEKFVSDLVQMGVDFETAAGLDTESGDEEEFERNRYDETDSHSSLSTKKVLVTEAYIRLDIEGEGIARLYKVLCGGTKYKLLKDPEPVSFAPLVAFHSEPEPHRFFGNSLVEMVIEDQNAKTMMLRGLLDNVAMVNTPGVEIVEDQVNVDDVLNNEIGRIVRVKQAGAMREIAPPFTAGATLPAMQYFDMSIEGKTGVMSASTGLQPDALQSTTAAGVQATVQAAAGQSEIIARNIAEGLRDLFRIMLKLVVQHVSAETYMRLSGSFVPVDPRSWNASMDMAINVGLGTNRHEEKAMVLREVLMQQQQIMGAYGPANGLVSMTNIRNTLADILKHGGLANADRYFLPMTQEIEQQRQMEAAQQAQNAPPDPNAMIAEAEQMKAQARMAEAQAKMQEAQTKVAISAESKVLDDDLARDKLAQDAFFKQQELQLRFNQQVNTAPLERQQAMPR